MSHPPAKVSVGRSITLLIGGLCVGLLVFLGVVSPAFAFVNRVSATFTAGERPAGIAVAAGLLRVNLVRSNQS